MGVLSQIFGIIEWFTHIGTGCFGLIVASSMALERETQPHD